jgi:hypothetical protein
MDEQISNEWLLKAFVRHGTPVIHPDSFSQVIKRQETALDSGNHEKAFFFMGFGKIRQ